MFYLNQQDKITHWGRDILEALSYGKPAISIGKYKKFVETKKTGLLLKRYDAKKNCKMAS